MTTRVQPSNSTGLVLKSDTGGLPNFLAGGGECGMLIASLDWSATPLGPIEAWPPSLRNATSLLLRSPVPIVMLWGEDGIMLYNDAYSLFAGARHPDLLGSKVREGWPEVADFNDNVMKVGLAGGTLHYKDQELTLYRHARPEQVFINLDYSPVLDESGTPAGVICILSETTESVTADAALKAERDRSRGVLENMAEGFILLDRGFRVLDINAEGMRLETRPREEILGKTHWEAWPGTEDSALGQLYKHAMAERVPVSLEHRYIWPDGREAWLDMRAYPIGDGLALFYRDMTERRRAEEHLRETSRRLNAILANTREAVFLMDHQQHCVYANAAAEKLTGYSFAEMQGRPLHDVVHHKKPDGSHYPLEECPIDRAFPERAQMSGEELFVHKDGSFYPVAFTASPVLNDEGQPIGTVIEARNIVDERVRDEALHEESRTLETLNRTGAAVAAELDLERVVQIVTDAGVELTGAKFGAFFYNVLNEAGQAFMLYTLSGAERSAFENFGMPRATAVFKPTFDGNGVIRSDDILADPRYGRSAPHYGMPKGHLPVRSYLAVPVTSRSGEVIGGLFFGHPEPGRFTERHERMMMGIAAQAAVAIDNARLYQAAQRELEERRRAEAELRDLNDTLEQRIAAEVAERAKAEEALHQSRKMDAVGQLVSGLAHDFNNLLGAVVGSLDLIRRRADDPERVRRFAEAGLQAAERGSKLTGQLLAFSRSQRIELKPLLVCDVIGGVRDMLARTLGPMIELEFDLNPCPVPVLADATQVEMTILNLAINARDAMPDGGKLRIGTAPRHIQDDPELDPGDYVELTVTDTGIGMDEPTLRKAMDPFFTTKPVGKGTGLGLAQVYGSARQSGGTVRIESKPGQGTTVRVLLPRTDQAGQEKNGPGSPSRPLLRSPATVLVVDDDTDLRGVLVNSLEALGYRVIEAPDGASSLEILKQQRPDVMLVDFAMPGMNGAEVAKTARDQCPGLPVVLTSGYADSDAIERAVGKGAKVLRKPFRIDELLGAVSDAVDNAQG